MPYIIYKILVRRYQYSIYTIYIIYVYISIPTKKYIKAAAIGQSEEPLRPILNCLNILQPCREDTGREQKSGKKKKKNQS